jgi:hypothetical protein
MSGEWHSPNEVIEAGIRIMLNGREPSSYNDQAALMNFIAFNVAHAEAVGLLMKSIYPERLGLLTDDEVKEIAAFQEGQR